MTTMPRKQPPTWWLRMFTIGVACVALCLGVVAILQILRSTGDDGICSGPDPAGGYELQHDFQEVHHTTIDGRRVRHGRYRGWRSVDVKLWLATYSMRGEIAVETGYKDGNLHGLYRYWHENGQLGSIGQFRNGKKHGEWTFFDINGNCLGGYVYENDGIVAEYDADGADSQRNGQGPPR